jgi:TM2 domain-containing membrane protein YozV
MAMRTKSKTITTWLALLLGSVGAHRFYLYGRRDVLAWLHPLPTLLGLGGAVRMQNLGQDDHAAWLLIPVLGLMLSIGMFAAIFYGLTPDERWAERHNPGQPVQPTGWGPVAGVVVALLMGGTVLMGTLAFGGQMFFEYQTRRD